MIKRIKYILLMIFTFWIFQPNVFAASLSIWANASNVTVGKTVTISVNAKDMGGSFNVTSSNNAVLSGGVTGKWLESDTYTFTFTAKSVGKATITVTPVDVATNDSEPVPYTTSKSVTLNVVEKKTSNSTGSSSSNSGGTTADKKEYSSDNSLKSLEIEGQTLNPVFNKDTTEYKLTLDESIEKVNVKATATHEKASVFGTGEKQLSSGENTLEVKVTAENGNEKIYKIIIKVEDQHPISVKVGNDDYTLVKKNNDLIKKLDYYEEIIIKINEQDVVAYENKETKVTLVILKDKDNKLAYYIYNLKTGEYERYRFITVGNVTLQLLDASFSLENYNKEQIEISEEKVDIFKIKAAHKVGLIYGTNVKTGNTGYYVYDKNEETLSKYFDDEVDLYKNELRETKNYIMILMGVVGFIGMVLVICSLVHEKKRRKRNWNR